MDWSGFVGGIGALAQAARSKASSKQEMRRFMRTVMDF
jgi:hypothetical protein